MEEIAIFIVTDDDRKVYVTIAIDTQNRVLY